MGKKNIEDLMNEFENFSVRKEEIEEISDLADEYRDKSEEEIFFEIIQINDNMEQSMSKEDYERVFQQLETIKPFLNEEQLKRLDKLLATLGK